MSAPTFNTAADALMTPGQVAALFHVDPKTVTRWAHAGRLARFARQEDIVDSVRPRSCSFCAR